jgi:uncharacterized protein
LEVVGFVACIAMGMVLGVMGGGGAILTVPILVYLFGLSPSAATSDSLFIVGLASLIGSLAYLRRGEVDKVAFFSFGVPSVIGVRLARDLLVPALPAEMNFGPSIRISKDDLILASFAVLMIAASIAMLSGRKERAAKAFSPVMRSLVLGSQGLVVGIIAGFVGAGGGFLIIPALVVVASLPMRRAVGTSLSIIAFQSLLGFFGDVLGGTKPDWLLLTWMSLASIVGIVVGSKFAGRFEERKLKIAFGGFVLVMGTLILAERLMTKGITP